MGNSVSKRSRALLGLAAILGAAALSGTSSATASPGTAQAGSRDAAGAVTTRQLQGWYDCKVGEVCLFVHSDGEGGLVAWGTNGSNGDFRTISCGACSGGTFDNHASSWWNRTNQNFCVSDGYWGGNPDNTMPAGTWGNFTPDWNDRASSIGYLGCP